MATQIIYNGTVIGTVDAGQSKILKCNGKKMKSDVEIRAGARTEIKYDGAVIATVEAGKSKTIKCAGETLKSNIEIRVEDDTPGKDGVSPTVEMIDIEGGTRIIITDVNGPKSTDIMDGKDGEDGRSIWYSTAEPIVNPEGRYVIILSSIIHIRDLMPFDLIVTPKGEVWCYEGAADAVSGYVHYFSSIKGEDGKTPVKGVDYYTEADKSEFSEYIASELARRGQLAPEYAESLEWLDANGDQSKMYVLPDGMIWAYMLTEVESEPINLLPSAVMGTDQTDKWVAGKGYSQGQRLSSSGATSSKDGATTSGYISVKDSDILTVENLNYISGVSFYFIVYDANKTKLAHKDYVWKDATTLSIVSTTNNWFTIDGTGKGFTTKANIATTFGVSNVAFLRFSNAEMTGTEVYLNKTFSSGTTIKTQWASTGHAFVPADYEDRIIEVENRTLRHTAEIAELQKAVENGGVGDASETAALTRIKEWDKPIYDKAEVTLISEDRSKPALTASDRTISAIYAKYRALMAAHPRYITETNMGKCTASANFTAVDMLRFDFKEPDGLTDADYNTAKLHETKPTIIFMSGIHTEWVGVWGLYYALEEIATNPDFDDIRRNAHIVVIPCANPFCLSKQTVEGWTTSHVNANGVAIHNNFGVNHSTSGAVGEYNYGGTAPYSELETQYIDAVMAEYPDAVAFVSCHNNDYSTVFGAPVIWASSATYHMCNAAFRLIDKISKAWLSKYGDALKTAVDEYKVNMDDGDYRLGRAMMSSSKGTEQLNATKYGIQGVNLEISRMMKVFSGDTDGSSEVMTRGAEVYANFMRTLLAAYDHKDKKEYAPNLPWSE